MTNAAPRGPPASIAATAIKRRPERDPLPPASVPRRGGSSCKRTFETLQHVPVESYQQYLLHRGLDRAKGVHGYLGRLLFREAERAGGDCRKRDRPDSELAGDLDGASIARSEYVDLSVIASAPDRSNRVDDEAGRKAERRGGLGGSRLAAAKNRTSGDELFCAGCSVNGPVNASTAQQGTVRGVDHRVDLEGGDVSEQRSDRRRHRSSSRSPDIWTTSSVCRCPRRPPTILPAAGPLAGAWRADSASPATRRSTASGESCPVLG